MGLDSSAIPCRIQDLRGAIGKKVRLDGWLYNRRSKGKIHFLQVRDGSGIVQCVGVKGEISDQDFESATGVSQEASLSVTGTVRADERAPGGVEISLLGLAVHQNPITDYPLGKQDHGPDFLLSNRHLWLRSRRPWAVMRIRHEIIGAIRDFFDQRGFICVDTPIFTPSACEGTSTLFEVDYFQERKAYLTQSGQLYNEANAMAFGKVYCFGPTFRAEKSKTRRHLTEFWMLEPEMAYATLDDIMDLAEEMVESIVERCLAKRLPELEILERDLEPLKRVRRPFPRISYDQAVTMIKADNPEFKDGDDFGAPDEASISSRHDRPVMVHRYPTAVKAFYMKPDPERPERVMCVDMIAPEGYGEMIGGGCRAESLEYLEAQIKAHGLPREAFEWYLDLRRYGSVPHGGFGLGLERTVSWICGIEHVREAIPYPRMMYRIEP